MSRSTILALAAVMLSACAGVEPVAAQQRGSYEVVGVEGDDMLKMRAGPGTGFRVVLGLPNGTVVRLHGCDQTGSTRWCSVSLVQSRALKGYVSWAYLRKK